MPLIGYNPWQDAAAMGSGIGRSLADVLMQSPLLALQTQRLQNERELGTAQGQEYLAHAGLYRAQQAGVEQETEGGAIAAKNVAGMLQSLHKGDDVEATRYMGEVLRGMSLQKKQDLAQQFVQMGSMLNARLGEQGSDPNRAAAAATGMPAFVTPHNVPRGGTAIGIGGNILAQGSDVLGPGDTLVNPMQGMGTRTLGATSPVAPPRTGAFNPSAAVSSYIRNNPDASVDDIVGFASKLEGGMRGAGTSTAPPSSPKRISSQAEYDSLQEGESYIDASGHVKVKGQR